MTPAAGFTKLRFKRDDGSEFPEWEDCTMRKVFTEISEKNHPEMKVLSIQQGVGTVLRDESERRVGYDKSNLAGYKAMQKGDFIIHLRSFEGGLECANQEGISSPAYRILRSNMIEPALYRNYFRSYNFIVGKLSQAVVGIRDGKNIDMDTFWQISIPVPCLEEQRKIADFLTTVDEKIAVQKDKLAALKVVKKGMLQKMFPKQGESVPELRLPGFTGDWEQRKLGELTDIRTGSSNAQDAVSDGEYPFFIRSDAVERSNKYLYDCEAILIPGEGRLGEIYHYINGKFDLHQRVYKVSDFMGIDGRFCYYALQNSFKAHALKYTVKATVDSLRLPTLTGFEFCKPSSTEEQKQIAGLLTNLDNLITLHQRKLETWETIKKGLMQRLFAR